MTEVFQTKRGIGGNCLAACLASIFDESLESMPDMAPPECPTDSAVQQRVMRDWLAKRGMDFIEIDLEKQAFNWTRGAIPSGLCLLAVESSDPALKEAGYGHFVVGQVVANGDFAEYRIIHDPVSNREGATSPPLIRPPDLQTFFSASVKRRSR